MRLKKTIMIITAALLLFLSGCAAPFSEGEKSGVPADGEYLIDVALEGGTGKADIDSPARLTVQNGRMELKIKWSSPYYDYMKVPAGEGSQSGDEGTNASSGEAEDGLILCKPVNTEGNSEFLIPVSSIHKPLRVIADTTAMSAAHEIEYTIIPDPASLKKAGEGDLEAADSEFDDDEDRINSVYINQNDLPESSCEYAKYLDIKPCLEGVSLVTIAGRDKYLIVKEGALVPAEADKDAVILQGDFKNIYLAASAPMDFFCKLGKLDIVSMTSTRAENWNIEAVKEKVEAGDILYVGKYSTPDFETVLGRGCDLCVESTMIYHKPETKEKLEKLGIPVLVDYSSYESEPLGRLEWIKLYGLLMGDETGAEAFFEEQKAAYKAVAEGQKSDKKVAYFFITANGRVSVKKSSDYIVNMIETAGGRYVFDGLEGDTDNAQSTVNMTMEDFYAGAHDADIIIYNSSIDDQLDSLDALMAKSALLKNFKAVENGDVWCTEKDMYQEITGVARMTEEFRLVISGEAGDKDALKYMHRLR